ncbi:conserved hypothetical protein [Xenorhabdus nematophila str. Anatoliense]|nr:conserved hypothetical protein [Xenorhabdus nematophila str. Anatoliense]
MRPNITITVTEPYLPLNEFCRRHAIPKTTANDMIRDGRLPVREKSIDLKGGTVFINMMALTVEALNSTSVKISFNTQSE